MQRRSEFYTVTGVGIEFVDIGKNAEEGGLLDKRGNAADGETESEGAERPIFFEAETGAHDESGGDENDAGKKEPEGERVPFEAKDGEKNESETSGDGDNAPRLRHGRTGAELGSANTEEHGGSDPDESDEEIDIGEIGVEDEGNEDEGEGRGKEGNDAERERVARKDAGNEEGFLTAFGMTGLEEEPVNG